MRGIGDWEGAGTDLETCGRAGRRGQATRAERVRVVTLLRASVIAVVRPSLSRVKVVVWPLSRSKRRHKAPLAEAYTTPCPGVTNGVNGPPAGHKFGVVCGCG